LAAVELQAAMPACARGAPVDVDQAYDGLDGHDLALTVRVNSGCVDQWWNELNASPRFECETGIEYAFCHIGGFRPGETGLFVAPRLKGMIVLKRNGKIYKGGQWR